MEPRRDLESRGFAGAWRVYQQQALDSFDVDVRAGDDRSYLVLPPGAGKTMIGLEAARRLGRRTLVLVPNTAVQAQWATVWDKHFPSPDPDASACGTERDLASAMNVLTYQSLAVIDDDTDREFRRAVLRSGDQQALLKLLHPNGRALIDRAAMLGPWTLVLDECHHLLATWGALVSALASELGPQTALIGLTATPVTALTEWQRTLHDELFGAADFVVATPALVKEGDLAPYQELVYLTEPTPDEEGWVATDRARFARAHAGAHRPTAGQHVARRVAAHSNRRPIDERRQPGRVVDVRACRTRPRAQRPALRLRRPDSAARRCPPA